MQVTFARVANNTTNGVALSTDGERDIVVHQIIVGLPVSAGIVRLYTITNAVNGSTTNLAYQHTFPTFSTTNINQTPTVIDFPNGLPLNQGGNLQVVEDMQVTVVWNYLDEEHV